MNRAMIKPSSVQMKRKATYLKYHVGVCEELQRRGCTAGQVGSISQSREFRESESGMSITQQNPWIPKAMTVNGQNVPRE